MDKHRKEIEELKRKLFADIMQNTMKYKYSIIKQFQAEFNKISDFTDKSATDKFERDFLKKFKLSKNDKIIFTEALENAQNKIAEVWNDYYSKDGNRESKVGSKDTTDLRLSTYDQDKMLAAHSVNFSAVEESIKTNIVKEFRAMINASTGSATEGYGFNVLRKKLVNNGLGFNIAATEAKTALSQFDNSYNTQMAHEAGIEKFIYDGSDNNSRPFCVAHLGNVYTIDELKAMDNGQNLPVETSLGGYSCAHWLTPYFED